MKTSRIVLVALVAVAAGVAGQPPEAHAYTWSTVTVDSGTVGDPYTSMALGTNGDPMISYAAGNAVLKFAMCDLSASTNGNCDQTGDWTKVWVGGNTFYTSIAVDANGDPVISSYDWVNDQLNFAICDLSASTNGNCDQPGDWTTVTVDAEGDVGWWTSIAVDANGDPVISYRDGTNRDLKFAICDLSASTNGNCDQPGDWSKVTVDAAGYVGYHSSMAVDANGDPMISYYDGTNGDLKFAICDLSASTNGNCDQPGDWTKVTVDAAGNVGGTRPWRWTPAGTP